MGITIAFEILALFAGSIFALLAFSFASRAISGGFIPALAVVAGILWVALFVNIDTVNTSSFLNGDNILNHYNVQTRSFEQSLFIGSNSIQAEELQTSSSLLNGDTINCLELNLRKTGNPPVSSLIRYGVYDSTGAEKYLIGTMNVTILTTSSTPYQLCNFVNSYTLISTDRIGVKYLSGDVSNAIVLQFDANNPFDSTITRHSRFNSTSSIWTSFTANDFMGRISLEDNMGSIVDKSYNFNDGATKIYMVAIGIMFMVLGAMQRLDKD